MMRKRSGEEGIIKVLLKRASEGQRSAGKTRDRGKRFGGRTIKKGRQRGRGLVGACERKQQLHVWTSLGSGGAFIYLLQVICYIFIEGYLHQLELTY